MPPIYFRRCDQIGAKILRLAPLAQDDRRLSMVCPMPSPLGKVAERKRGRKRLRAIRDRPYGLDGSHIGTGDCHGPAALAMTVRCSMMRQTGRIGPGPCPVRRADHSDRSSGTQCTNLTDQVRNALPAEALGRPVERALWCDLTTGLPKRIGPGPCPVIGGECRWR